MDQKILIVDAQEISRKTIRLLLEKEGWTGLESGDGNAALKIMEEKAVSLILYDLKTPPGDGTTFFRHLQEEKKNTPVILLSGFLDLETMIKFKRLGAFDLLIKPVHEELLLLTVKRGLEYGRLIEDRQRLLIENQRYQENLEQKLELLKTLAEVIETKDAYTRGHCERVTEVALETAQALHLSIDQQRDILLAGILHDVGKIGIPKEILTKAGPLDQAEWALIEAHPHLGLHIIRHVNFLGESREIILQHHERFDGTGYPRGLKGEEIHLGARILAVADAFDAMGSGRPYHHVRDQAAILEEMRRQAGLQFDPEVVDAFITLMNRKGGQGFN
jgi:response regulator RpfG family c-di-GMP phosphodiesterase